MRTNVYVDGFNLYYLGLRAPGCRWLNLAELCRKLLPTHTIQHIKYFTARVLPQDDPQAPQRQQVYLRALGTIPNLSIEYGQFLRHPRWARLVSPSPGGANNVQVWRTEEKGSDVNLASHLLLDAFDGDFELAVVISNDSDLMFPIKAVRQRFGLDIGVYDPSRQRTSAELKSVATFYFPIREGPIKASQFPDVLTDGTGTFWKPPGW